MQIKLAPRVEAPLKAYSPIARQLLIQRYLRRDENGVVFEIPDEMFRRVAGFLATPDRLYDPTADIARTADQFYRLMTHGQSLPSSPMLMGAGSPNPQCGACYVIPVRDDMANIFEAVKRMALIQKPGGGTGFSFSELRPNGDIVKSTGGEASGPVVFMQAFNAAADVVKQGGRRSGANMGTLRADHPDVLEFIRCKQDTSRLSNFNISVQLTAPFRAAVLAGTEYDLINPRTEEVVARLDAREVLREIAKCAWATGEPGVLYLDTISLHDPTPQIEGTLNPNPCGEALLKPNEMCVLASTSLPAFVDEEGHILSEQLGEAVRTAVHFLDNAIDTSAYPDVQIETATKANRKIGLGIMGLADFFVKKGVRYGSQESIKLAGEVMKFINDTAVATSEELARSRGPFSNFPGSVYDRDGKPPRRNATVTSVAPTGSISILAGVSAGCEPYYALVYKCRNVLKGREFIEAVPLFRQRLEALGLWSEGLAAKILDAGSIQGIPEIPDDIKRLFVTAHEVPPEAHLEVQAAIQRHTENAVSKTINLPSNATVDDVERIILKGWELGIKGLTVFRDGCRDQVISTGATERVRAEGEVRPAPRPDVLRGNTVKLKTGCGNLFVTVNKDPHGKPLEVFCHLGKAGGCAASQCEALGRAASLALRSGISPEAVIKQLSGITCHARVGIGPVKVLSCADGIAQILRQEAGRDGEEREASPQGACPECGGRLIPHGICMVCESCGHSECG